MIQALIRLLRPRQWVKNLFVFPAPLFGHALVGWEKVGPLLAAFWMFCFLSSAVYAVNDILDREADRRHPLKRMRPLASGALRPGAAAGLAAVLLLLASLLALGTSPALAWIGLGYIVNSALYIGFLKRKVIADVLSIAVGFMLRILGGAAAVGVEPSPWLMICGFSIALFLAFCKRRSEIAIYSGSGEASGAREVLLVYTREKLDLLTSATAAIAIVTYMVFTVSPDTIQHHGTKNLIYTTPFAVYGVLRFLMKTLEMRGEDAAETLIKDAGFMAAGLGWTASVALILYCRP